MAFGQAAASSIHDPLVEPLWTGRRVLVHMDRSVAAALELSDAVALDDPATPTHGGSAVGADPTIVLHDEAGLTLAGHPALRIALAAALRAEAAVVDGYLTEVPAAAARVFDSDVLQAPGFGEVSRQLLFGSRGAGSRSGPALEAQAAGHEPAPAPDSGRLGIPLAEPAAAASILVFVAIDLLALDGEQLLDVPLLERKRLLDSALATGQLVRRSPHVRPPATSWYRQWRALGFREIAVKHANSRYHPGKPSRDWARAPIPAR